MSRFCRTNQLLARKLSSSANKYKSIEKFWSWTTQKRPSWRENYVEAGVLFCVFGVTGSSTLLFIRPALKTLGLEGSLIDGPWSYRILSILLISPAYAVMLILVGTLSGRHQYCASMSLRILNRFFPKILLSRVVCNPALKKM